jgi:hypothetical protein
MRKAATRIAVMATLALLAIPGVASARPWGGEGFNDLGPAYLLLGVNNGQAKVRNVQLIIACTDVGDGTESSRAFDARFGNWENLRLNRFRFEFTAFSNGRIGLVRLRGVLRSDGTGAARVRVIASAQGDQGAIVERCGGSARIELRRGGS